MERQVCAEKEPEESKCSKLFLSCKRGVAPKQFVATLAR